MKVFKSGKEVKNASVVFNTSGVPVNVVVEGVTYDASAYELKDEKSVKKTKVAPKNRNANVMTTKDV